MASSTDSLRALRRFYTAVDPVADTDGFSIHLDGRPVQTPAKARLILPTAALADMIAEEWRMQSAVVLWSSMPATRLAFTAADRIAATRAEVAAEIARTAGSDLLCYFAPAPRSLVERQTRRWGAVLDWAQADLGLTFMRVAGVTHQPQPPATLVRVETLARDLDDFALAGLALAAGLFSSTILAFALLRDVLDGAAAFDLSRLDETFQEDQWGVDSEAAARADALRAEALMLERWFLALR